MPALAAAVCRRYDSGGKAKDQAAKSKDAVAEAGAEKDPAKRAAAFDSALKETSLGWQKMLYEHGLQSAENPKLKDSLRFGLTLDDELPKHLDSYEWVVDTVERSGTNWVRLVFKPNPGDFTYAKRASFNEYDSIVKALRDKGIRVMGCVLDTAQWPRTLTPEAYAKRTRNLALHFTREIRSWEVGSELNGDWLGSPEAPFSPEQVLSIFNTAAAQVKSLGKSLETVATLYWWDGAAPDDAHSLFGWLRRWSALGFGRNLDVLGVNLQPDDQPVGTALETIFDKTRQALPAQRLMVGSLGYAPQPELDGWYWADAGDVEAARRDVLGFYTPAACAIPHSHCGGFWWLTLEQLLPETGGPTKLYDVYRRELKELGR